MRIQFSFYISCSVLVLRVIILFLLLVHEGQLFSFSFSFTKILSLPCTFLAMSVATQQLVLGVTLLYAGLRGFVSPAVAHLE